jgi:hypothetical protein
VEFAGLAPGRYSLRLASGDGHCITGPFEAKELATRDDVRNLTAVKVERVQGAGTVRFEFKVAAEHYSKSIAIHVRSSQFQTEIKNGLTLTKAPGTELFHAVFGPKPDWFKLMPAHACEVHHLPPGEYKVLAITSDAWYGNYFHPRVDEDIPEAERTVELGAFTIKGQETVDLGALSLQALKQFEMNKEHEDYQLKLRMLPEDKGTETGNDARGAGRTRSRRSQ